MNKEDILKAYLEDPYFVENGVLKEGESDKVRWIDHQGNKLIGVIKQAIEGITKGDGENVVYRKINQTLEREL
jgi:hypothetical protein